MAWGDQVEWLEKWAAETGEVAECLNNRPDVPVHLLFVWSAYLQLRTDRQVGLDKGPIMFSSINAYAQRYHIDDIDLFDRFVALIRAMDNEERSFKPEQQQT